MTIIRTLPHILARVFGPPLLVAPAQLDTLLIGLHQALQHRGSALPEPQMLDEGNGPSAEERPRGYRIQRGVATLPIHGVLMRRSGEIDADSRPFQSYENLSRVFRNAQSDSRVRAILLDVDSPGGEAGGVFDLAREIRAGSRSRKPVWAMANDDALSAAYVLASAADRVWATETASLGSLGVVALHADQSSFDNQKGLKYTYLYKGAHKIDANPHGPLTGEAQTAIQGEVDRLYEKLVTMVADHRHTDPARVRNTEAAVYFGERALNQGLADKIGTIDEAHAALVQHTQPRGGSMDTTTTNTGPAAEEQQQQHNPTPPLPPPQDSNVVPLARVTEAEGRARALAREIAETCALAKLPELAASFIGEGLSMEVVRQRLQAKQAEESAKRPITAIDTSPPEKHAGTVGELKKAHAARLRDMYGAG